MGIFSSDIVTQEVKNTKKLQFMISIEEHINKHKNDFIHDHANDRDKILFWVLDNLVKDTASRFGLLLSDGEINSETHTYCAGRFRYIRGNLYIVVKLKDSRKEEIKHDFTLKHSPGTLKNLKDWDDWDYARNRMYEEIESTCECNGEMILIYDKNMNLVKEKMSEYGFI